jgi:hypothetical protein
MGGGGRGAEEETRKKESSADIVRTEGPYEMRRRNVDGQKESDEERRRLRGRER